MPVYYKRTSDIYRVSDVFVSFISSVVTSEFRFNQDFLSL